MRTLATPILCIMLSLCALTMTACDRKAPSGQLFGVRCQDLQDTKLLQQYGPGVFLTGVTRGSKADAMGLQPGDVIYEVNGIRVKSVNDMLAVTRNEQVANVNFVRPE